jgi:predicted O-linked N-acetylglucosamine transferase (SPINDLY family)
MDYILADRTVIPDAQRAYFSEKVVWLPDTFQVNDSHRAISEVTPTRRECGLPDQGFVFCCFNNAFKILPTMFDVWMRLVGAIDDSVLWLAEGDPSTVAHLRQEAEQRGISAKRLVFAPRTQRLAEHLARHRQADLFLDTMPFNAHATASDALWAGLPIITCLGSTYAARVTASLLKAVGLDELITGTLQDYEALALKLAQEPAILVSVKERLARNRASFPLFNTERFTRHIESAYATMWQRYQRGEPPSAFAVEAID